MGGGEGMIKKYRFGYAIGTGEEDVVWSDYYECTDGYEWWIEEVNE